MSKNSNEFYREQELVSLINAGVDPKEAVEITNRHLVSGNYDKTIKQVADAREKEKASNESFQRYASELSARIKSGENPEDVVNEMNERQR